MIFSTCTCADSHRFLKDVRVPNRYDPTGTDGVRRRYESELTRRLRALKKLIREALVKLDILGLKPGAPKLERMLNTQMFTRVFAPEKQFARDAAPQRHAYAYGRPGEKVSSFMEWLRMASRSGILSTTQGASMASSAASSWANIYIDTAYQKGIRDAYAYMGLTPPGGLSAAFGMPIHADRVGLIYTRNYAALEGITSSMDQRISRILAQGIAEGRSPNDIAGDIEDQVDIGITRARTLARSEIMSAHAEASLNSFREAGIEGVSVLAEFATAEDDAVCPECEDLEGKEFNLDEAEGMIPVHPNCRCTFIPVVQDVEED